MLHGKKIVVVMPAYHAEKTLEACYRAIPLDVVDEVLLVDDASRYGEVARSVGVRSVCWSIDDGVDELRRVLSAAGLPA